MKTGFRGTFVIPWSQTEVDGVQAAPVGALTVGSTWRRLGAAMRIDGPDDLLLLGDAEGETDLRRRAARAVNRLVGAALNPGKSIHHAPEPPLHDRGFVLTDGTKSYTVTEISAEESRVTLLMFIDALPPIGIDLWVVRQIDEPPPITRHTETPSGVICFARGTLIVTPDGPRPVETLEEGHRVLTRDNGPRPILWRGSRRMSGARLHAMPHLRPVRIRTGALGQDRPEGDLLVSPEHRVLVRGRAAEILFRTPEVLVAARDLINDSSILTDHALRDVTYVHLMLEQHQIVWANGLETESFHPAGTSLDGIDPVQRASLLARFPAIADDPHAYGDFARRNLTRSEAAILQYESGTRNVEPLRQVRH